MFLFFSKNRFSLCSPGRLWTKAGSKGVHHLTWSQRAFCHYKKTWDSKFMNKNSLFWLTGLVGFFVLGCGDTSWHEVRNKVPHLNIGKWERKRWGWHFTNHSGAHTRLDDFLFRFHYLPLMLSWRRVLNTGASGRHFYPNWCNQPIRFIMPDTRDVQLA